MKGCICRLWQIHPLILKGWINDRNHQMYFPGRIDPLCGFRVSKLIQIPARFISCSLSMFSASTRHWTNVGLMLIHSLRRRPVIQPTLAQWLMFALYRCISEISRLKSLHGSWDVFAIGIFLYDSCQLFQINIYHLFIFKSTSIDLADFIYDINLLFEFF